MKTSTAFYFCILFYFSLFAQKAPIKWGKVSQADLKMKTYELDQEAEAVVLADYARLYFDFTESGIEYTLDHHVRIKILKKSAYERGDVEIPYYSYKKSEKLSGLKAQVILPNGEKISVNKKDIFDEKVDEYWSSKKIAFPSLEEGCIIEYKYSKRSGMIYYLEDWYFQSDIPTRLSEFRTEIPEWFHYVSFDQGLSPKIERSETSRTMSTSRLRNSFDTSSSAGSLSVNVEVTRYIVENAPALKREPFITTMRDYYSKLSLQLQFVKFPNSVGENVTGNWEKVAKDLEQNLKFGVQLNKKRFTRDLVAAIDPLLADDESDEEKISTIYSYLSQNIQWNKEYGITSPSLDEAFRTKSASSGELNLMFIAVCRRFNIEAYPILISTRNHGRTMEYYPKLDQFNHVIAYAKFGEKESLFDVGSPTRDPKLLRMNSLNYRGWLVDGEKSQWIEIPGGSDTEVAMANLTLEENGNVFGTINKSLKGYCAMDGRTNFHKFKGEDHKDIREEWQEAFPDINIKSINFENEQMVSKPLKCNLDIEIPEAAQANGEFIYLSPMLGLGYDENPLKQEERTFPVDIALKSKNQFILNLTIPNDYVIEALPEAINLKMDGKGGAFQYLVSHNGQTIQVISKVSIKKLHYEPEEYGIIKNFFDIIVEKHGEQIVLKKKS